MQIAGIILIFLGLVIVRGLCTKKFDNALNLAQKVSGLKPEEINNLNLVYVARILNTLFAASLIVGGYFLITLN